MLLKAKRGFTPTRPKDVFGSVAYDGPAKSIADMNKGIAAEAKRRQAPSQGGLHLPNVIVCPIGWILLGLIDEWASSAPAT